MTINQSLSALVSKKALWKFLISLALCHLGTQLSLWSFVANGSALFYLTVPIALVLMYWWGPVVLVAVYINAALSAGLWELEYPLAYPLYALPETIFVFLSWLLFMKLGRGRCWFPNIRDLTLFLIGGLLIPLFVQSFILRSLFLVFDQIAREDFWPFFISTALGDFISTFGLTIPVLYFFTSRMQAWGLTGIKQTIPFSWTKVRNRITNLHNSIELGIIALLILLFSSSINFSEFWYLYGIISLYSAIRYGFGISILINTYILLLTYITPLVFVDQFKQEIILGEEMLNIQIGSGLLYVFSVVTGRVISDARSFQRRINKQNEQLEHVNKELDRFVYSVSHDLSAPLKSIRGLVNISRTEKMNERMKEYIDHIEMSTNKLEGFISDILDFSRNDRVPVENESIDIKRMCLDILDGLKFFEHYSSITIDTEGLNGQKVNTDKFRLRIVLTNLLSNAIKYQDPEKEGKVIIRCQHMKDSFVMEVEDNGEGFHPGIKSRIFDMFYRGTVSSHGSGLGLYITKEVVEKLGGSIEVESTPGKGSKFSVFLPVKA